MKSIYFRIENALKAAKASEAQMQEVEKFKEAAENLCNAENLKDLNEKERAYFPILATIFKARDIAFANAGEDRVKRAKDILKLTYIQEDILLQNFGELIQEHFIFPSFIEAGKSAKERDSRLLMVATRPTLRLIALIAMACEQTNIKSLRWDLKNPNYEWLIKKCNALI